MQLVLVLGTGVTPWWAYALGCATPFAAVGLLWVAGEVWLRLTRHVIFGRRKNLLKIIPGYRIYVARSNYEHGYFVLVRFPWNHDRGLSIGYGFGKWIKREVRPKPT